jgi:two-component system, chemotaxis family, CheB/CheR fusion protein
MMSDIQVPENSNKNQAFPVVAIGGSTGGVDALKELLQHLPKQTGMAYLYIQHADHGIDNLGSSLAEVTEMPVIDVKEPVLIQPNHVFLLSSDKSLHIDNGVIKEDDQVERVFANMPINQVFSSLAECYKEATIGIVLSGPDADGSLGLKAIRQVGGVTFAQDDSAVFNSMPHNATIDGAVDLILSPKEIADELLNIARHKDLYYSATQELNEAAINNHDESLSVILHALKKLTSVDFSQYKMNTIKRRIIRRMMLHKLDTLQSYVEFIHKNANEINLLYQDVLINVTYFFRDADSIDFLTKNVIPQIIHQKGSRRLIRVWVPACSTGQEAYTIAMLIVDALGERSTNYPVQVFATDLSELAINKARLGIYSNDDVVGIPPRFLHRFFTKIDGSYRIVKSIRDLCVFAIHNIVKDPPFSHLDLISCCNLLIYLDNHLQKKLMATFHYSLNNNGYLILGKSETVGTSVYLFSQLDKKYKIYAKKKDAAVKAMFEMNFRPLENERNYGLVRKNVVSKVKNEEQDIEKAIDTLLLKKYTPASVVVNSDLDILQFRGSTGLYLEPAPGKASLNLMKMGRQGLGFELRSLVHKVQKTKEPIRKEGIEINVDAKPHRLAIEVVPLKGDSFEDYFLVVFEPMVEVSNNQDASVKDQRVIQLEAELSALREDMRSIIESQEAANEELQSANEEIVSSNEELQSINEELETSKEEIESSNEELITINQELQIRNEQLAEAVEYSDAVFATIRESLLILDKNLRVKTANQAFYKTFHLKEEETEGRLVYDLKNLEWNIPELRHLLEEVEYMKTQIRSFQITNTFSGIGEKVMLFNACKVVQKTHGQELILLAIEDITEHSQAERMLAAREAWFRNMADNAPLMIWVVDTRKFSSFFNKEWLQFRGLDLEGAIGKNWYEGVHPDDLGRCIKTFDSSFAERKPYEMRYRVQNANGEYKLLLNKAKPNITPEGEFLGYIGSCVEIGV